MESLNDQNVENASIDCRYLHDHDQYDDLNHHDHCDHCYHQNLDKNDGRYGD